MPSTASSSSEDKIDDQVVENFIYGNTSRTNPSECLNETGTRGQKYSRDEFLEIPSSNEKLPPGIDWRKEGLFQGQESYSSFGDKGTTASVNAYGSILQISKYLGVGTSGIFCADPDLDEPWFLRDRMEEFLDLSTDPAGGFGLCLDPQLVSSKPRLQFLHNRWPRFTYNIEDLSMSIQYFANRGTVIQQYLFETTPKSDAHTSRGASYDVNQNAYEDHAPVNQAEDFQAQEIQIHDVREQNQLSSGDCPQESQAEEEQTQDNLFPQNETKIDETSGITQKNNSVKDCLRLESRLRICESEWADPSNDFNIDDPDDSSYDTFTGQNQYSLVVCHQRPAADEAVGLVIAVFINGHLTKITRTQDKNSSGTYEIDFDSENIRKFEQGRQSNANTSLRITVAYKLRLMAKGSSWKSTLIPVSVLDLTDLMAQNSYGRGLSLSTSTHFDFIMKRNLEHILSVCSVPVSVLPIQEDEGAEIDFLEKSTKEYREEVGESRGGAPIALTCGDISGHHVLISASFFAFQFLLAIYSYIDRELHFELEARIFETLKGHLEWVFLHIKKDPDDSSQFLPGYWANGQEVTLLRYNRNSQHTSLPIIIARDFASGFEGTGRIPSWFVDEVGNFMESWVGSLRKGDSRDYCVFQRVSYWGDEEGYYLRDHVLIWKALGITEVLEDLRMESHQDLEPYFANRRERRVSLGIYTAEQARKRMLKRFTTQSTSAGERMFATYRDTRDNSFFLDTMDTILFYGEKRFFQDDSKEISDPQQVSGRKAVLDEWIQTLKAQTRHKRTDDKDWREPLQYALAIQMAKYGHQIDSRPVTDIFDGALKVLLQSCSASGIFPGFLTHESKTSSIFNDDADLRWSGRDSYWHTSFELPYILWVHAKERLEETSGQDKKQAPLEKSADANQRKTNKQTQPQIGQPIPEQSFMPKFLRAKTVLGGQDFTDQKNVFEISDEWLVPCPEFLHFDPKCSVKDLVEATTQRKFSTLELRWLVIDIPKRRNKTDDQTLVDAQPCTNEEFFERLRQWRTRKANMLIKKRIIWLASNDEEAAAICPASVPESEQLALTGFFGRHNNWDKHFLDDPSAVDNSWKTEFHLSFYQLEHPGNSFQSKPEISLAKRIRRASMGFRFNGDFFDCYWTCHIINFGDWMGEKKKDRGTGVDENTKAVETLLDNFLLRKVGSSELAFPGSRSKKRAWHQRKVLELILFEEIIRKVTAGTQKILKEIKDVLDSTNLSGSEENEKIKDLPDKVKETVLFSKIDGNAYFSFSAQWEVIQQLLQVLDEDLSDTIKKIDNWQVREKNRGTETPRWTKKDEKRYRPALRRMQLSNAESVRGLLQLKEKAQSLRSSLISRRNYIRDDLNLRGAENTRYFTYVTVVFLPLGFATGIFSMSATPGGTTLARMSVTAAITFLLTVIALYFVVVVFEAFKKSWVVFTTLLGDMKDMLKELLEEAKDRLEEPLGGVKHRLKELLREVKRRLKPRVQQVENAVHSWVLHPLGRLLLTFYLTYVLWKVLGGSMDNLFSNQDIPSPQSLQSPNEGSTQRRRSTVSLPEVSTQDQGAIRRRPASLPGDLESQIRPRHSF